MPARSLSVPQQALLDGWLPDHVVVEDLSWGLVDRCVLAVEHEGSRYVVKAGGPDDHHQDREIRAHREWLVPLVSRGRAPELVQAEPSERMLLTRWLPGSLVEGTLAQDEPDTYRQAGALLALLHRQGIGESSDFGPEDGRRGLAWLDRRHRIPPETEARLRAEIGSWQPVPVTLVPTHGDWQPRNWLAHDGKIAAIDFGRTDLRPAMTDLSRLATQDFARDPALEAAFLEGYGEDPREPVMWRRVRVLEAIGTAVWAHLVGDEAFEAQGHRMIAEALAEDR